MLSVLLSLCKVTPWLCDSPTPRDSDVGLWCILTMWFGELNAISSDVSPTHRIGSQIKQNHTCFKIQILSHFHTSIYMRTYISTYICICLDKRIYSSSIHRHLAEQERLWDHWNLKHVFLWCWCMKWICEWSLPLPWKRTCKKVRTFWKQGACAWVWVYGPLARYAKSQVRMRRECRERFPRHRR